MLIKYSSESFTRTLILLAANRMKDKEQFNLIRSGSYYQAPTEAKEIYFKFGSAIFTILGVGLLLFGAFAMMLTLVIHGLLGFGFFFYYAPGAMCAATGYALGVWEKRISQNEETDKFTIGYLLLSWSVGIFIALFIATFSVLNTISL